MNMTGSRRARRRPCRAPIIAGLALLGSLAWTATSATAEGAGGPFATVNGTAVADGVRMTMIVPGAPVTSKVIDAGGPSTQADLSTFTGNRASAALPYPGDGPMAGPGTAAGALGSNGLQFPVPFPSYPFFATAEYPARPEQKVGDGPYVVETKTGAATARGVARSGFHQDDGSAGAVFAISTSSVEQTTDRIVAEAVSDAQGLTIGPLTIGQVRSKAKTEVAADGQITRSSSMALSGVRVADSAIGLTPSGVVVGTSPLPAPVADFMAQLNRALAPSKIQVFLMGGAETPHGVVAPVLDIRLPIPDRGFGPGSWRILLGGTSSSVDVQLASAGDDADASSDGAGFGISSSAPAPEGSAPGVPSAGEGTMNASRGFESGAGGDATAVPPAMTEGSSAGTAFVLTGGSGAAAGSPADSTAAAGSEPAGGEAVSSLQSGPRTPQRQVALPAARRAAQLRTHFDIVPVYSLFGGLVLTGLVLNIVVGGVRRRWTS